MTMYASNAGKSGGEFFTPADVSELLTRLGTIGKTEINKVYDPACGSGSLLLKAEKILGKDAVRNGFYGQEQQPLKMQRKLLMQLLKLSSPSLTEVVSA